MARLFIQLLHLCLTVLFTQSTKFCVLNSIPNGGNLSCDKELLLQDLAEDIPAYSDVEIYFCEAEYSLNTTTGVMNFTNVLNIVITGLNASSHINCNNFTGFYFKNVETLEISNVQFTRCQLHLPEEIADKFFTAALYITESFADITITNVSVTNTDGIGMVLANNSGYVNITNSSFDSNNCSLAPGGGIFIESFTTENTTYNFVNCNFTNNDAGNNDVNFQETRRNSLVRGGGMKIYFRDNTSNVDISLMGCLFENNTAKHGGGLYILFQNSAQDVRVRVETTNFTNNYAFQRSGAVALGYYLQIEKALQNLVSFRSCNFIKNKGRIGGAVYFISTSNQYDQEDHNRLEFDNCIWKENQGTYGYAVIILRQTSDKFLKDGRLSVPLFKSCSFIKNRVSDNKNMLSNHTSLTQHGRGALYISSFHVELSGNVSFIQNEGGSAVYLFSSILTITANSFILFRENTGYQGGAINLIGFASIYLNNDVGIIFDRNHALCNGGAIFHSVLVDKSYLAQENCFIRYDPSDTNIILMFTNNSVGENVHQKQSECYRGTSIFLTSSIPCSNIYGIRNWTAIFEFEGGARNIATRPSNFSINEDFPKLLIPGKDETLNISGIDDVHNQVKSPVYQFHVLEDSSNITIDPAYKVTPNNKIKVYGKPGSKGRIEVNTLEQYDLALHFEVILDECPPGLIYNNVTSACECSTLSYLGIIACSQTEYRAILLPGYWAGYNSTNSSEHYFRTSSCPIGYCSRPLSGSNSKIPLPDTRLSEVVCAKNREGVLCGNCVTNTSVYYHTQGTFECGSEEKCNLGLLLFFVSEIIPVTVLFLVIILFDIQLTTGALNGFMFYMQVFSSLQVTIYTGTNNFVTSKLLPGLISITSAFNLEFFSLPGLEFCLFKGANSLHLIAFDYVIVVYSFFLVVLTVICLNWSRRCRSRKHNRKFNKSIIHGLSGFLVMCYAKTTTLSLEILTRSFLHGADLKERETVACYQGNIVYFSHEHLKFAIPAIFALIFMTCLPPFLLLIYPLCYKVLALLKLEESNFTRILCKAIPLERFKPLFDSFQSEFKDNHRYFAGLYFIYRLLVLTLFAISKQLVHFYFSVEALFVLILIFHSMVQPYKKNWHNKLDQCILLLISAINGITTYTYTGTLHLFINQLTIVAWRTVQVLLAYLPLIFVILYLLKRLPVKRFMKHIYKSVKMNVDAERSELSLSMLDQGREDFKKEGDTSAEGANYFKLK